MSLPQIIPFAIPASWTAEQALAVFDLLDDLRDRIWAHYELQLRELMPSPYQPRNPTPEGDDDPLF